MDKDLRMGTDEVHAPLVVEEAGTPPGDRRFRPDVQGLRAVAVGLVIGFHFWGAWVPGGYVGVDVFFVISGFVITGLLLRESGSSRRISLVDFYARRARRIIPAASVTIMATVACAALLLGQEVGRSTAVAGLWAALFASNVHFAAVGSSYLGSQALPSPLQNFWSLSVEEQFYLVYPLLFLVAIRLGRRLGRRRSLNVVLIALVIGSLWYAVALTSSDPVLAYFSPLTRACELGFGALVAINEGLFRRLSAAAAATIGWVGLALIVVAAWSFDDHTAFPGTAVLLPIVGASLVIASGATSVRRGPELLLGRRPMLTIGVLSYALYLVHGPILIIVAERHQRTGVSATTAVLLLAVSVVAAVLLHTGIENPFRHNRWLIASPRWSLAAGVAMVLATVIVVIVLPTPVPPAQRGQIPFASPAEVNASVRSAPTIASLPAHLRPALGAAASGYPPDGCYPMPWQVTVPRCEFGDVSASRSVVLYGDSHSLMWFNVLDRIAKAEHFRLYTLGKGYCMANDYSALSGPEPHIRSRCEQFHAFAARRIRAIRPDYLIMSQAWQGTFTSNQWQRALEKAIRSMTPFVGKVIVLGDIPYLNADPPLCLATHPNDVQQCSARRTSSPFGQQAAERQAAATTGSTYVDVTPWFCSVICSPVVDRFQVYANALHVTSVYAERLGGVLAPALGLR